jgi:hypothetical protein
VENHQAGPTGTISFLTGIANAASARSYGLESDVIAFAQNLFDKNYYTNAYEKAFVGGMFLNPSYRSFGVKVTVRTQ